jgi:hypothetical protein
MLMEDYRNMLLLCQEKTTNLSLQRDINNLLNKPRSIEDMVADEVRANVTELVNNLSGFPVEIYNPKGYGIYEYWLVTEMLARQLKSVGEYVGFIYGKYIWGRTCTGQAIYQDDIIKRIYATTTGQIA